MSLLLGTIKNKVGLLRQFKNISLKELDFKVDQDYMLEDIDEKEELNALEQTTKKRARGKESLDDGGVVDVKMKKINQDCGKTETCVEILTKSPVAALTKSPEEATSKRPVAALIVTLVDGIRKISIENLEESFTEQTAEEVKTMECLPPVSVTTVATNEETVDDDDDSEDNQACGQNKFLLSRMNLHLEETSSEVSVEDVLAVLEKVYKEERMSVVGKDNFISTPLHALKHIANKFAETIHNDILYLDKVELPKPLVRVELIFGAFRGVGEAFNKRMAAQVAAIDVLMRVENVSAINFMVPYAIFPGWRVRPQVCMDLMWFCKANHLKMPKYKLKTNPDNPEKPSCLVEVFIGDQVIAVGESDLVYVARRLAACNAIERLTGEIYPLEHAAFGTACTSYEELMESDHVPVISEAKKLWLLDENTQGISDSARGVDLNELDALECQLYIEEMEEMASKKRRVEISLSTDAKNVKRRIIFH